MEKIRVSEKEMNKILNNQRNINGIKISEMLENEARKGAKVRNKLSDLNNYLFEELERVQDDSLNEEEFKKAMNRAKTVSSLASAIIQNANTVIKSANFLEDKGYRLIDNDNTKETLKLLGGDVND